MHVFGPLHVILILLGIHVVWISQLSFQIFVNSMLSIRKKNISKLLIFESTETEKWKLH